MEVRVDASGYRHVVAARAFVAGEVILDEEPCFYFAGPLARVATLGVAALDAAEDKSFLRHFAVPQRLLGPLTWREQENPIGPDSDDVVRLVRDVLAAAGGKASVHERLALALALVANAHPCGEGGTGLFEKGAMFDHCCLSGNVRTRSGDGRKRVWFAGRDVAAGEQLNACYIDQSSPVLLMETAQRRRFLAATKLFDCQCSDCTASEGHEEGIVCGTCLLPFLAGKSCGACGAEASVEFSDKAWKVFALICGGSQLGSLPDDHAKELLQHSIALFGPHHWAGHALGLALLTRPTLFAEIAPLCLPQIAFLRDGPRRLARVALGGTAAQLERVVLRESRRDALKGLTWLSGLLRQCRDSRAFRDPREYAECDDLIATVDKTLLYAADPEKREACCVACAMATHGHEQAEAKWGTAAAAGEEEGGEGDEDFEVAEEYDDIIL